MNEIFNNIIDKYKNFPQVSAIAIGGSQKTDTADANSDIDIYVFTDKNIPVQNRLSIIKKYSSKYEAGCEYFGAGDEFWVDKMNKQLDVMYMDTKWMENTIDNVWNKHCPSNGYTTCFLFTLKNCETVYDKKNWLDKLKKQLNTPYPEELKLNIINRNIMLLKDKPFASYYNQIEKALSRDDYNSVNHRIAAFIASYFDIIFANNKMLHPGEKKLVQYALKHCKILPENFTENIDNLLTQPNSDTLRILDDMICKLKKTIIPEYKLSK